MVQRDGINTRARNYKEDFEIFQYMKKQGMLSPSEESDMASAVQRFRQEISAHPQTNLQTALDIMQKKKEKEEKELREQKEAKLRRKFEAE